MALPRDMGISPGTRMESHSSPLPSSRSLEYLYSNFVKVDQNANMVNQNKDLFLLFFFKLILLLKEEQIRDKIVTLVAACFLLIKKKKISDSQTA